ncbi:MAG: glycosyltransferase, exosortase A system-associated [Betaproteobacteria bacterium]|nr:glycosyltransferase, exosortase A system-associated [Betaproteobacteria bacterium]
MRILHVLDHSIPSHSGYAFRTLSILKEQRKRGWETFHVTSPKHPGASVDEEDIDGWHFFRTRGASGSVDSLPGLREFALMRQLTGRVHDVAMRVKPDVIHAHSPVLNAIPALRVARRLGIPVVYEVRAFWEDAAVDHGTAREGGLRYRLTRALETYALRRVDRITTICEGLRGDIVARGIAAAKVTVIPNAVDVDKFQFDHPGDEGLRSRLGLQGCTVLGFLGSFYAYEGLALLLDAMPMILSKQPKARVLLVGGGPQEMELKAKASQLGIENAVIFLGRVPHAEIGLYYDLVDVLVYPRYPMRLTELVTPLKPLEAMAQGRLLIASDVGGHRELIRDGETGILFKAGVASALAGAVEKLLSDPAGWPLLRRKARTFVEKERTWQNSVSRYEDVYGPLVAVDR